MADLVKPVGRGATDGPPVGGQQPAWLRELETALLTHAQVMFYGNVRDTYLVPGPSGWRLPGIRGGVWSCLEQAGYRFLVVADPVDGLQVLPNTPEAVAAAQDLVGTRVESGQRTSPERLLQAIRRVAGADVRAAVMIDYAARLVRNVQQLEPDEHHFFAACEKLAHTTRPLRLEGEPGQRYNPVLWVVNGERDLPAWFTADNPALRRVALPMPDLGDRRTTAEILAPTLLPADLPGQQRAEYVHRFAAQTQSLTLRSMVEIARLAAAGKEDGDGQTSEVIEAAARSYRVGIVENPWSRPVLRGQLIDAHEGLGRRVLGQPEAVARALDIVTRSVMGLSGAQASATASRPRGVLFFAGPTGVGKTELAKALTELVFGDERAYIRFDMSEFAAEHAADRLIGAPPGYVGHDAGGELTNSIRQRPFSLVLFDEIEKAHPRILDKFLQILDEGRLTDGMGSTVYFSEALLVFTSNLGMTARDANGVPLLTPDTPRDRLVAQVTAEIGRHMSERLNRPELLNRIGDNIVVFNFIAKEAATDIFDLLVDRILGLTHRECGTEVRLAADVRALLLELATADTSLGGRGIGSVLETALVNPLARALFAQGDAAPAQQTVVGLLPAPAGWEVVLA
ncbi:AAA family ATPase [Streptomyces sp. NBC_01451]|uniref:AAA family ATPase n=1 Tax=Streptomyces sp. NBC_01451 TaxID=2903872 RepID=UPI002E312601|nr:AAA family ATPase [Streptomyces sp. NBC_01451]